MSPLADAFPALQADVVVANFPFGIHDWGHDRLAYDPRWVYGLPPRTEPELAWIQHALAHLAPGKTAVLLMPPAAAARPAGRRIRAEFVRRGALQAVVALPAGLMLPTGIGLHVWVLTRPQQHNPPAGRLLFVDSTAAPKSTSLSDTVAQAWRAYLSDNPADEPGVYRIVPAIDVLDDQVDLTPRRYLPQAVDAGSDPAHTLARMRDFDDLLNTVRRSMPTVRQAETPALQAAPQADIGDLMRSGSLSLHRTTARTRSEDSLGASAVLTSADVLSGGPATGTANQSTNHHSPVRVKPGDILIPVIGQEIAARVATAEQTGAELGPGVHAVRVNPDLFDPWFIAGVLSGSDNVRLAGRVSSTSGGSLRIDIKRLTIPVLSLDQQKAYGEVFRKLADFRIALGRAAEAGETLARDINDGLTSGSLTAPS